MIQNSMIVIPLFLSSLFILCSSKDDRNYSDSKEKSCDGIIGHWMLTSVKDFYKPIPFPAPFVSASPKTEDAKFVKLEIRLDGEESQQVRQSSRAKTCPEKFVGTIEVANSHTFHLTLSKLNSWSISKVKRRDASPSKVEEAVEAFERQVIRLLTFTFFISEDSDGLLLEDLLKTSSLQFVNGATTSDYSEVVRGEGSRKRKISNRKREISDWKEMSDLRRGEEDIRLLKEIPSPVMEMFSDRQFENLNSIIASESAVGFRSHHSKIDHSVQSESPKPFPVDIPLSIVDHPYTEMGVQTEFFDEGVVPVTLTLSTFDQKNGTVTFVTKVANIQRFNLKFIPDDDDETTFSVTSVSIGGSTRMMGTPAEMSAEAKLSKVIENLYAFRFIAESILLMSSYNFSRLEFSSVSHPSPQPSSQLRSSIQFSPSSLEFPSDVTLHLSSYRVDGLPASFWSGGEPVSIQFTQLMATGDRIVCTVLAKVWNTRILDIDMKRKPDFANKYTVVSVGNREEPPVAGSLSQLVAERKLDELFSRMYEIQLVNPKPSGTAGSVLIYSRSMTGGNIEVEFSNMTKTIGNPQSMFKMVYTG